MKSKKESLTFNVEKFLLSAGVARNIVEVRQKESLFSQGDPSRNVMYIQKGEVKILVVSPIGKEAVVGILGPGNFLGEGGLAGQPLHMATIIAVTPVTALVIENMEMIRVLHAENAFSDHFISYMLKRNMRIEEDLIDQLFNSSEKRLARTLLVLARDGGGDKRQRALPRISQETLAGMIGTTRSRVNLFMSGFKKMGFIKYDDGGIQIDPSLLTVVLHE